MELTVLDFEKMAEIAVVIKEASDRIEAITGEKPDLRLFDSPPEKPLINHDDFVTSVMQMVAGEFDITIQDLKSRSRKKPLPDARGVAMIAIHQFTRLSLKKIGLHFGGRDHSTVITRMNETFSLAENEIYLRNKIEKTLDQCKLLSLYVKTKQIKELMKTSRAHLKLANKELKINPKGSVAWKTNRDIKTACIAEINILKEVLK